MKKLFFILLPVSLLVACQKSEIPAAEPAEEAVESRAKPGGGGGGGSTSPFTMTMSPANVVTDSPEGPYVGAYGYIGNGGGGNSVSARGFCYSTSPAPTVANTIVPSGSGSGFFFEKIVGLAPGTYYIRIYAYKSGVVYYSNQVSFIVVV